MTERCAQAFCRDVFLVDGYAYSPLFCGLFGVATVSVFSSVNNMTPTSFGEYFSTATVLKSWALHGTLLHPMLWGWRFSGIDISQGSAATHLRSGGIFMACVADADIIFLPCGFYLLFLVHGQVTIIFVVSVCLFVCLFVCAVFVSRLWSDFDQTRIHVIGLGLVVSPRI